MGSQQGQLPADPEAEPPGHPLYRREPRQVSALRPGRPAPSCPAATCHQEARNVHRVQ
ncbi:hypothetical protein DPMN_124172 [Dreissena polymorpha]|uniref:Uncharacterized protein n=1 Tax=Dreissena polymorpha TaxID=45954 RepID=A0A9D4JTL2_DREPO|nr:hypothetical protein DPMN_124172 [Dreissena polymorpha]